MNLEEVFVSRGENELAVKIPGKTPGLLLFWDVAEHTKTCYNKARKQLRGSHMKHIRSSIFMLLIVVAFLSTNAEGQSAAKKHIYNCGRYKYTISDDGTAEIVYYWGTDEEIEIPEILDGITVSSIGDKAFYDHYLLTHVSIPNSVIHIGKSAFENCKQLISVVIPDSVRTIDDMAFKNCSFLSSVFIPGSVTYVGKAAFANCASLKNAELSEGTDEIDDYAFFGCYSLESVSIPNSVTFMGTDIFLYRDRLQITVVSGSLAESYCKDNGLNYVCQIPKND